MSNDKVIDFTSVKATKEFIETASTKIFSLEHALYSILEVTTLKKAKELAAEALEEDIEIYLEVEELDFDNNFYTEEDEE